MKLSNLLAVVAMLAAFAVLSYPAQTIKAEPAGKPTKVGIVETSDLTAEELRAEYDFLADPQSPKLFPMDKAQEVSKLTGKPVLCWMGKHVFANENARKLSQQLKDTTIQASMEGDGTKYDRLNPRLKFDTANYQDNGKVYTIRAVDFKFEGPSTPVEETTAYKVISWFQEKKFPAGKDAAVHLEK